MSMPLPIPPLNVSMPAVSSSGAAGGGADLSQQFSYSAPNRGGLSIGPIALGGAALLAALFIWRVT